MSCSLSHTCHLQVLANAQRRCPRDIVPAVPRALLLGLREERPAFKDHRELDRGKKQGTVQQQSNVPLHFPDSLSEDMGEWGQGPSGSYTETSVPSLAHAHGIQNMVPRRPRPPHETDAPGPTAHLVVGLSPGPQVQLLALPLTTYLCACRQFTSITSVPLFPRQSKQQPQPPQRWPGLNGNKVLSKQ